MEKYLERLKIVESIREFLKSKGFLEVYTPSLTTGKDPSVNIKSFETTCGLSLITSPEFDMKKLLSMGLRKIFQVCHFFRKGELLKQHNPEFLGIEWYEVGKDYTHTMELLEELVAFVGERVFGLRLKRPFKRVKVLELFEDMGFSKEDLISGEHLYEKAKELGYEVLEGDKEFVFNQLFSTVQENLKEPTFVMDFPSYIPSLAREKDGLSERFEFFMNGIEVGNAYTELTDRDKVVKILTSANKKRIKDGEVGGIDESFALLSIPPSTGIALGVERLHMALLGIKNIENVLLPFERELFRDNLRYLLCSRLCYYYKPGKKEEGCGSYRFFMNRKELWDRLVKYAYGKLENIEEEIDKRVYELICKSCPYLVGGCDFRDGLSNLPCGGYKIVYRILKHETDTV